MNVNYYGDNHMLNYRGDASLPAFYPGDHQAYGPLFLGTDSASEISGIAFFKWCFHIETFANFVAEFSILFGSVTVIFAHSDALVR